MGQKQRIWFRSLGRIVGCLGPAFGRMSQVPRKRPPPPAAGVRMDGRFSRVGLFSRRSSVVLGENLVGGGRSGLAVPSDLLRPPVPQEVSDLAGQSLKLLLELGLDGALQLNRSGKVASLCRCFVLRHVFGFFLGEGGAVLFRLSLPRSCFDLRSGHFAHSDDDMKLSS